VITLAGNNNLVRAGSTTGTDFINAGVGGETVTGGDGNFIITAGGYNNIVVLSNGTDMVFLPADAANPSVPVGSPVLADLGGANVTTGTGNDTIKLGGYGNRVDAGSGSNVIFGGAGNDTFVLPKAFQGLDTISGFNEANGDILDIRNALAATSWNHSAATLGTYLQIVSSPSQTSIAITPNGTGPSSTIAVLSGSGNLALADLLSHHSLLVG
jgi:Ca2+-binding RTX toxin-like protein